MAASAALILRESPSMKKAVSLINEIDIGRFPRLLTRILQKLHLKAENSFSEEEEEKLQAAFSLERQDLHLVLETISFILEQAVYYNVKPAALQQQLENIHLRQDKAEAFVSAWSSMGQETIEKFRQRILAPHKLETVGWQLNLQMAHSAQAKLKSPQAVLQLGVSNEDSKSLKKVLVEFSHKELFDFYNKDCRCGRGVADGRKFLSQTNQHVLNFHPLQLFPASSPYESVAAPG
ncbi:COMM domain-containing protein 10 isoform X4 [Orcinus orca]|uniref:COMM domain-containing protein 10 isoform X4 n=1 Tax=Sagmatias obliquidens TaxID=3371155 RepID=UPI000F440EFD|nr:COMM domain-containing protein 10 isoform X4 [Lagenorhynchus obliquidens]XP_033279696.1 COMM domain-containing protein 10 isoform X4 [Orcinus orca]